jgi:hypothetical protein
VDLGSDPENNPFTKPDLNQAGTYLRRMVNQHAASANGQSGIVATFLRLPVASKVVLVIKEKPI